MLLGGFFYIAHHLLVKVANCNLKNNGMFPWIRAVTATKSIGFVGFVLLVFGLVSVRFCLLPFKINSVCILFLCGDFGK